MDTSSVISIHDLSGSWVMQGIAWITRKAIAAATTTLKITQGSDTDGSTSARTEWMRLEPALTGGLKGIPENRPLTWAEFEHNDTLFGPVIIRSHYIAGVKISDRRFRPVVELQTKAAGSNMAVMNLEVEAVEETVEKAFIHDFVRSVNSGWAAEQIWAVEIIGEEQFLTRRIVVVKGTATELARVFYRRV
ncbi:hypothetical protein BGW36DRAFT_379263 [Talaromyces proteolyticus]|uniref:Uncharacterized protein n=1 Tax=Talaromyces proteolyticus TaxID=1131652 RepID=A0AAD4KWQ2_9EURO|nr:uncharacterized protein BGW36DRAFT_379263 [Talaromyces proteolyticus]KAH8697704.1 hypothetical protein BGW36DRAFT_379263 [Talaromyces proteolyticus]